MVWCSYNILFDRGHMQRGWLLRPAKYEVHARHRYERKCNKHRRCAAHDDNIQLESSTFIRPDDPLNSTVLGDATPQPFNLRQKDFNPQAMSLHLCFVKCRILECMGQIACFRKRQPATYSTRSWDSFGLLRGCRVQSTTCLLFHRHLARLKHFPPGYKRQDKTRQIKFCSLLVVTHR